MQPRPGEETVGPGRPRRRDARLGVAGVSDVVVMSPGWSRRPSRTRCGLSRDRLSLVRGPGRSILGGVIDRAGLADFLRRRRETLRPADVGLPDGVRRRTPGLRRDEVAHLAGMSTDYYTRLEQRRGANPSPSIVAALARALRCDLDERDHLFHLAGLSPPPRRAGRHIRPGLISLAERLTDVPVCICTDLNEVLWQNAL